MIIFSLVLYLNLYLKTDGLKFNEVHKYSYSYLRFIYFVAIQRIFKDFENWAW